MVFSWYRCTRPFSNCITQSVTVPEAFRAAADSPWKTAQPGDARAALDAHLPGTAVNLLSDSLQHAGQGGEERSSLTVHGNSGFRCRRPLYPRRRRKSSADTVSPIFSPESERRLTGFKYSFPSICQTSGRWSFRRKWRNNKVPPAPPGKSAPAPAVPSQLPQLWRFPFPADRPGSRWYHPDPLRMPRIFFLQSGAPHMFLAQTAWAFCASGANASGISPGTTPQRYSSKGNFIHDPDPLFISGQAEAAAVSGRLRLS